MRLELSPGLGGAVTALSCRGVDWLRRTPDEARDVLQTACFPLVPFANRIAGGRVAFGDRIARLPPNLSGTPHPIHGEGWRGAWEVAELEADRAALVFTGGLGGWPFRYVARQEIRLDRRGVTLGLSITNTDDVPAPAGLGFHPYFPEAHRARLTAQVDGMWLTDPERLPTRRVTEGLPADWRRGAAVAACGLIDNCHTGWTGEASVELGVTHLRLAASPELAFLQVYTPPGEAWFCVEPVSHRPDALNAADPLGEGVRVLAPGVTLAVEFRIEQA